MKLNANINIYINLNIIKKLINIMGKKAKEHRKKVQARNKEIEQNKNKTKKMQQILIEELIKQEKEKGLFENDQKINNNISMLEQTINGPTL